MFTLAMLILAITFTVETVRDLLNDRGGSSVETQPLADP